MKEIILSVLGELSELQINLQSQSAREDIANAIIKKYLESKD
jgi:hypothetical protein